MGYMFCQHREYDDECKEFYTHFERVEEASLAFVSQRCVVDIMAQLTSEKLQWKRLEIYMAIINGTES
jgi:hypothetical protein